jgi:hypothetical protein
VGSAVAVYEEKASAADPFQVWGRLWNGGAWSAAGQVQSSPNEGRFADCVRHSYPAFLKDGVFIAWRETDANDPSSFRVVAAAK